jgi:pimeloyl-ACP methyl ester carboxylesterase
MFRAKVNGLSVAYERAGEGPALVLLQDDSRVWRPQLESLSAQFTVIAWDAPGAGQCQTLRKRSDWATGLIALQGSWT